MPYISETEREDIHSEIGGFTPHTGGELQYAIAYMINNFYGRVNSFEPRGVRYKHMEEMMGALDGAAREHYRMVVAPYEDTKIQENGGVYDVKHSQSVY